MTTLGCAVSPVGTRQTAATTPLVVRYQPSSSSPASASASFGALKVATFVTQQPQSWVSHFHGRRDSFLEATWSSSVDGLIESRKSHVAKV